MGARTVIVAVVVVWAYALPAYAASSALVEGMMDFFDMSAEHRLTEEERAWIRWGADHEGVPMRQMQHRRTGARDPELSTTIPIVAAGQWIHDRDIQSQSIFQGNYTWEQSIADAVGGDRQRGYEALGHVLRVLEDASVPDTHGSFHENPYWRWIHEQSAETVDALTRSMRRNGVRFEHRTTVDAAFDAIVVSADILSHPTDVFVETHEGVRLVYGVVRRADNELIRVARWTGFGEQWTGEDSAVLTDMWNNLAPVTIRMGASVIELYRGIVSAPSAVVVSAPRMQWWGVTKEAAQRIAHRVYVNAVRDMRFARDGIVRAVAAVPPWSPQGIGVEVEPPSVVAATDSSVEVVPSPAPVPLLLVTSVPLPLPLAVSVPLSDVHHRVMDSPLLGDEAVDIVSAESVIIRIDAMVEEVIETPVFHVPSSSDAADTTTDIQGFPIGYMPSPRGTTVVVSETPVSPDSPVIPDPPIPPAEPDVPESPPVEPPSPPSAPPNTSPSAIDDLSIVIPVAHSDRVTMTWTAPIDGEQGSEALTYRIRYATVPIMDDAAWDGATTVSNPPAVSTGGVVETFEVSGLMEQTAYFFAVRTFDGTDMSALSNSPNATTLPAKRVEITQANFQGGASVENIVLTNTGGQSQSMQGWTLFDDATTPHTYTFGVCTLAVGASVTVHTGVGVDTATDVYWNRGSSVWNDGGDTATLKDASGTMMDSESW